MSVRILRREDPMLLDSLIGYGADASQRAVPGKQRRYAFVLGVSKSRASRHLAGDEHAPATSLLVRLACATGASAWPMIAEGIAVVMQMSVRKASEAELHKRLGELDELEHASECDENRETLNLAKNPTPERLEKAARANVVNAEHQLERAGILRELARRARRAS